MRLLFLFLDGVGLGSNNVQNNPFAAVQMPNMASILNGYPLTGNQLQFPLKTNRASLIALDANLGVAGRPQSASGQAALLTGKNIPLLIGTHFGPKPNKEIRIILEENNIFSNLKQSGYQVCLLNAFPEGYFKGIESGLRLPGVISMAAQTSGIHLKTSDDLNSGEAISPDFTAKGWRERLGNLDTPLLTPFQAGERLGNLAERYHFSMFEYWLSDYVGHKRDMAGARKLLESFDQVLGGLLSIWNDDQGIILITSDHGNLEDLSIRNHTRNPVPAIVIGSRKLREKFTVDLEDITDIYAAIIDLFECRNDLNALKTLP